MTVTFEGLDELIVDSNVAFFCLDFRADPVDPAVVFLNFIGALVDNATNVVASKRTLRSANDVAAFSENFEG